MKQRNTSLSMHGPWAVLAVALLFLPAVAKTQDVLLLRGVPVIRTANFDAQAVTAEDQQRAEHGDLPLYGRLFDVDIDPQRDGAFARVNGEDIWQVGVASPSAVAVELYYDDMLLPEGASITVRAKDGTLLYGPYTAKDMNSTGIFSTPLVPGDGCILEYRVGEANEDKGRVHVGQVGHAYRDVEDSSCEVDVACSEGDAWTSAIAGTVRISVVLPAGTGWCSGALVNNVRQDCTPYILSAWHSGAGSTTAQYNLYKFYFGYQRPACGSGTAPTGSFLVGAQLRACSNDESGTTGSDFMLLEMNSSVPHAFAPYWLGWDATLMSTSSADGVGIHHPMSLPKKVSTYTQTLLTQHWGGSPLLSHWRLNWAPTNNGYGVTEEGSSGSPLFKKTAGGEPVIIGTLTGSSNLDCDNPTGNVYYGKVSYDWLNNPNTATQKLKYWLDPDNTGTLVLNGSADPCAQFMGVSEVEQSSPAVLPVPADQRITVRWVEEQPSGTRMVIVDATGRCVFEASASGTEREVNTSSWRSGMYAVRLLSLQHSTVATTFLVAH